MESTQGAITYMDIIISSTSGIIPQITGFLSKSKYFHTHFFVHNTLDYIFMCHIKSTDILEALDAKRTYGREIYKYSKEVKYIHADNSTYACKGYKDTVHNSK